METIEIDDDLLELLKGHAEPFVDTPNDVLRRLPRSPG
jgi:negative regulator of replication initiation